MNLEKQYTDRHIGKELLELGISKRAAQRSWVWDSLNNQYSLSPLCVEAIELTSKTEKVYPAFTIEELTPVLKEYMPYFISIWGEFGFKSLSQNKGVGYDSLTSACGQRLIYLLKSKKYTIDEYNEKLIA